MCYHKPGIAQWLLMIKLFSLKGKDVKLEEKLQSH